MSIFVYTNARVRAWKSNLLDKAFFEKLMAAKDNKTVIAMLGKTGYQPDIEKGVVRFSGVLGVEEGLRQNLTRTFEKLIKISKDSPKAENLVKIVLSRWDTYNLKTIFRGLHAGASEEEIFEQLIPIGVFDEAALRTLAGQPSMKSAIGQLIVLSPEYAAPLIEGYKEYEKTNNLSNLELGLDKSYFESIVAQTAKAKENQVIINGVIKREIDLVNLMVLFRQTQEAIDDDLEEYFIEGGAVPLEKLLKVSMNKDVKKLVESLSFTPYRESLREGYRRYQKTGSIAKIERALEDYMVHKNISLFRADLLSAATVVAYVWAKINEIINIRIILRGKEVEMPAQEIREALVLV